MPFFKDPHKVEIYTLAGLKEFADMVNSPEEIPLLKKINTLDLEGLSSLLYEKEKKQAVRLLSFILRNDPYIEDLLLINNATSKSLLESLSLDGEKEEDTISLRK